MKKKPAPSQAIPGQEVPCSLLRRVLIMLYDAVLVTALLIIAAALVLPLTGDSQQAGRNLLYTLYLCGVWFLYLGWCWTHGGQTLGMRAWSTAIKRSDGKPISWAKSLVRFSTSLLSLACAGVGFLVSVWRPDRSTWHDRASGTFLVRTTKQSQKN